MKGFNIAEQGHVLLNIYPRGTVVTAALTSACFSLENWQHATILVAGSVGTGTTAITVGQCASSAASGWTAITFKYAKEDTAAGDTLDAALVQASSVSFSTGPTGVFIVIEIDADMPTDGYSWLQIKAAAATARDIAMFTVLSGGRYQEDITGSVLS